MVAVKSLIDTFGIEASDQEIIPKLRSSLCRTKGRATFFIAFVGGFGEAILGAKRQGD